MELTATIVVVDDDTAFLDSIQALLGSMGLKCRSYTSGREFLDCIAEITAECVILDLNLPGLDGIGVIESLARSPDVLVPPIIVLTGQSDVSMAVKAMRHGVVAFLQKQSLSEASLWDAIQEAIRRHTANRELVRSRLEMQSRVDSLNASESLVLTFLLRGKDHGDIAQILGVSRRTVENRRAKLMKKLDVTNLPELIRFAMQAGLIDRGAAS